MARYENPAPSEILAERMAQIERAYKARLRPRQSASERAALERERKRQIRLAQAEFKAARASVQHRPGKRTVISKKKKVEPRVVEKPRRSTTSYPIGGVAQRVSAVKSALPPAPDTPTWRYRDDDGTPIHPWDVMTHDDEGRQLYDDDDTDFDDAWGGDENYTYDDFEADWGEYDHQDTGYADETAYAKADDRRVAAHVSQH